MTQSAGLSVVLIASMVLAPLTPRRTVAEASRNKSKPEHSEASDGSAAQPGLRERLRNSKLVQKIFYAPRERVGSSIFLSTERGVSKRRAAERVAGYIFLPSLAAQITLGSGDPIWIPLLAGGILVGTLASVIESGVGTQERKEPRRGGFLGAESLFASGARAVFGSTAIAGAWLDIGAPILFDLNLDATKDPTVNFATWMAIAGTYATVRVARKLLKNNRRAEESW